MSQISPPIRILLVLTVAVLGVYMLFLRPKPEEAAPVEPAGTSVTQTTTPAEETAAGESAAATKADKAAPQPGAAADPAQDLKGLPKPVRKAIREEKILVLLFSNGKSYDDKAVEKALTEVNRWDGRVFVHTAPLARISRYGRIARGVNVEQSPTVVVADRMLRAETLVGFVDRATIDQAVLDARRNTSGLYVDAYLKAVDKVCFQYSNRVAAIPFYYYTGNERQADRRFAEADRVWPAFVADYKAVKPSAKWRSFHNAMVADLEAYGAALHSYSVAIKPTMSRAAFLNATVAFADKVEPIGKRADRRLNGANLPRCGSQF